MLYDVTLLSVRPGTQPRAIARLQETAPAAPGKLLACWTTDIGALNQILIIREYSSAQEAADARIAVMRSENPLGTGEFAAAHTSDTYELLPFLKPLQPGNFGPFFEVRTYLLKPGVVGGTIERWQKALPKRTERSPLLAAMNSASGLTTQFMHIWPYKSMDERHQVRTQAVKDGIWPPPGGGEATLLNQKNDIYVATAFSPIK
ncbi:MAG TPA: NIPSNAP family protein [Xanthobacteraceae bacterium]|nr:NIPSNAP family protein [Xanthobacteraceae bacterium]